MRTLSKNFHRHLVRNGWCEVISLIFLSPFLFGHTEQHIEKLKTTHIINFMYVSATSHLAIYNFKIVGWGGPWRNRRDGDNKKE